MGTAKLDISSMLAGMSEFESKAEIAVNILANTIAKNFESDAKDQAKWTDRTAHARQRIKGYVTHPGPHMVRVNLSHGVEYGVWLELANEKRYAIVEPIVRLTSPFAMESFEKLFDRL